MAIPSSGVLAAALALSASLHLAAAAWLEPRAAATAPPPRFELRVALAEPEIVPIVAAAKSQPRRPAVRTPRAGPVPPPLVEPAEPRELEPMRVRLVANPSDYGLGPEEPGRRYAWPGQLDELPIPDEGIAARYPAAQLGAAERGLVVVRIEVSRLGQLESVRIVCGRPPFDAAIADALHATRFRVPVREGAGVPAWALLEFAFLAFPKAGAELDPREVERELAAMRRDCGERSARAG